MKKVVLREKGRVREYVGIIMKAALIIVVMLVIDSALAGIENADIKKASKTWISTLNDWSPVIVGSRFALSAIMFFLNKYNYAIGAIGGTAFTYAAKSYMGIGEDLMTFFNKAGVMANVTTPGAHRDQSAGYYNGGGLSVRNRVKNEQIATMQLPEINAGCGGIDMFMGGFSHISKDALIAALRNIGTNAAGYAFKLGIKTIAPMIDGVMEEWQRK